MKDYQIERISNIKKMFERYHYIKRAQSINKLMSNLKWSAKLVSFFAGASFGDCLSAVLDLQNHSSLVVSNQERN